MGNKGDQGQAFVPFRSREFVAVGRIDLAGVDAESVVSNWQRKTVQPFAGCRSDSRNDIAAGLPVADFAVGVELSDAPRTAANADAIFDDLRVGAGDVFADPVLHLER